MQSKVAVIIPVYNSEKTLRRCVESLVLGKERSIEVVLVDDCSGDESWACCQELAAEFDNVKCIQNEKNSGVSFSRNRGIEAANTPYLMFVDSDDWVSCDYVSKLLHYAEQREDRFVLCGLHFINKVTDERRDYVWNTQSVCSLEVERQRVFELQSKFLLQQIWNKVFCRSIILHHNIRFDEKQSMGEDFQFVVDYLAAAKPESFLIVNEPLYYYIRWNTSSLMSNFGIAENENEFSRLKKLLRIAGESSPKSIADYNTACTNLKNNYLYQLMRSPKLIKSERIELIERILQDGHAQKHYRKLSLQKMKERAAVKASELKKFPQRAVNKFYRIRNAALIRKMKKRVPQGSVSIISQNCIGGVLYHDMGMAFESPTINLFFKEPDFVRFALDLEYYLGCDLKMEWGEEYPIGRLDDVAVYFMHYATCKDAKDAWDRRKQRVNMDRLLILSTDMEGFDDEAFELWRRIKGYKVLFSATKRNGDDVVYYPEYAAEGCVRDLIPKREFYKNGVVADALNRIAKEEA